MALILIIEDEYELRAGLASGLRIAGFDVIEAADGHSGYAAILDRRPDLVLCDISMPGLRGDRLLLRLRREHPEMARMPFLFLTALADRDSILAGQELGADDYLTKPVDLAILAGVIRQRLGQADRWRETYDDEIERQRAAMLAELSERSRMSFLSAADVLNRLAEAVILVDPAGRATFVNRAALHLLCGGDGLAIENGRLIVATGDGGRRLREALAAVGQAAPSEPSVHLNIDRPSGRRPYALRLCRLDAGLDLDGEPGPMVAVFLADPVARVRLPEIALCARYGFTPTEARIVADLALGHSVEAIADLHGISRYTIHHHLKSIFRKTETTRQPELVALVLSSSMVEGVPVTVAAG